MNRNISSGGPQESTSQQRVLVLPVVPVDLVFDRVDALRSEAFFNVRHCHDASVAVIADAEDRLISGLDQNVAFRLIPVKRSADRSFRKELEWQPFSNEVSVAGFPFPFLNG